MMIKIDGFQENFNIKIRRLEGAGSGRKGVLGVLLPFGPPPAFSPIEAVIDKGSPKG